MPDEQLTAEECALQEGFDPSRSWPLQQRHQRLPKWARLELAEGIVARINDEMAPDIRGAAKRAFGGNCSFSDDDLMMLEHFACWALDQGYRAEISDKRTLKNIEAAIEARRSPSSAEDTSHA